MIVTGGGSRRKAKAKKTREPREVKKIDEVRYCWDDMLCQSDLLTLRYVPPRRSAKTTSPAAAATATSAAASTRVKLTKPLRR